jgi:hypothetical protein
MFSTLGRRVVLAVDRAGLETGIDFGIGHRRRVCAERRAEELPGVAAGHAQLDACQVGWGLDLLVALQTDLANAEIGGAENFDAELVFGNLLQFCAGLAGEERLQMRGVAEQIAGGDDGESRNLLGHMSCGAMLPISRLPRCSATSSVPCLNRLPP